jgi:DNA-binding NarL/FixJ family response regulator
MPIRVAVADDSLLVREGLQHLLEEAPEVELVAVSADRESLMEAIEIDPPDVVLTDLRMPPTRAAEGIEVADTLRESHPEVGVIVISDHVAAQYAVGLLEHGAARRGYLLKERVATREQLVAAIEQVAAGGSVIDPAVVDSLFHRHGLAEDSPVRLLSSREREVLAELAAGKSNAAIARSLVISKRAVEHHVSVIFAKLDLPDEGEASRRVLATLCFLADEQTSAIGSEGPTWAAR